MFPRRVSPSIQTVKIFGATGSIGLSFQKVLRQFPDRFALVGASAYENDASLFDLLTEFHPKIAAIARADDSTKRIAELDYGEDAMLALTELQVDTCIIAISGSAGLRWALACLPYCHRLAIANKESLVMGGRLFQSEAKRHNVEILPIDSEHSALLQLLAGVPRSDVRSITLTASGGPFWEIDASDLPVVTPERALEHPIWGMGKKITIDSATLMNKGLEIIEAAHLFDFNEDSISVLVHPQACVHAMIETIDRQSILLAGVPDMRSAIALALTWPERLADPVRPLDTSQAFQWDFFPPDNKRFPCLELARSALKQSAAACIILNAANEVAVDAFLNYRIGFSDIPRLIEACLTHDQIIRDDPADLSAILGLHNHTLEKAHALLNEPQTM